MTLEDVQKEIEVIKARNKRVEADKAWEVSWSRRGVIAVITYTTSGVVLFLIGDPFPLFKAFVPTLGYVLSTLSIPLAKSWWLKCKYPKIMKGEFKPPFE